MDPAASIINRLLIPHPAEPALLVLEEADGSLGLPWVEDTTGWHWAKVDWLNAQTYERYGLRATVLRFVSSNVAEETRTGTRVCVMETHLPVSPPEGTRWASAEDFTRQPIQDAAQRTHVDRWLAEAAGAPVSPLRTPWARPGWFDDAAAWLERTVAVRGLVPTGPVEQVRAWTISTILKVPTRRGDVYFKASGATFPHEAAITAMLASRWPEQTVPVLEADPDRSWLAMHDLGGERLARVTDVARWETALRTYAEMQVAAVELTGALLDVGCQDRRLAGMHAEIDLALTDAVSMVPDHPNPMTGDEVTAVQALAPALHDAVDRLAAGPIPETLEHGDFHPGNIVDAASRIRIYDWSDACIAHPFFSLLPFFAYNYPTTQMSDDVPRLRAAYLEPWIRFASMEDLVTAAGHARRVAVIQQVMSYRRILQTVEPALRWEWADAIPYFLRMLLSDSTA